MRGLISLGFLIFVFTTLSYGQSPTLSGNNVFTGNNTFPNINSAVYVDGTKYASTVTERRL